MNLEQQKKQARELLREIRSGSPDALARLRRAQNRWAAADETIVRQEAALHDAQFVLAREQGFASWTRLKAYAEPSPDSRHSRLFVADVEWIAERARGLVRTRHSAGPSALDQIREWHPRFTSATDREILNAPFTEDDARLVYAREHGFASWEELTQRVEALASRKDMAAEPFLAAFGTLQSGDAAALRALLNAHPGVARERGTNGNTLLNLAVGIAAGGGGLDCIQMLLDAGADANEGNDRGATPLHQAAYSNRSDIAAILIQHAAALDAEAHGAGGTPLAMALFWGHREVADLLGSFEVTPKNLRTAAGLGRADLVEAFFNSAGALLPEAAAARGFYRPHSGFPDWQPSSNPQEILDEALVWACKSDRVQALEALVRAGAHLDADPYRGTPLIWAAFCNRTRAAAWLLDRGADVNRRATFGGATHGQGITALHIAAQYGHLDMAKLLVERGADRFLKDDLHGATPVRAAEFFGQTAVWDYLKL